MSVISRHIVNGVNHDLLPTGDSPSRGSQHRLLDDPRTDTWTSPPSSDRAEGGCPSRRWRSLDVLTWMDRKRIAALVSRRAMNSTRVRWGSSTAWIHQRSSEG